MTRQERRRMARLRWRQYEKQFGKGAMSFRHYWRRGYAHPNK